MLYGIDAGASATKISAISVSERKILFSRYEGDQSILIREILPKDCTKIALTGVRAELCGALDLNLPVYRISELEAIAKGATFLTGKDRAIVASIGTGTALVLADEGKYTHIGGSGIGGGTLLGIAERFFGVSGFSEFDALSKQGDEKKVDLTIGDLFSGSETLPPDLTASNLAKKSGDATAADWIAGTINLVLEAIGSMAMFAASGRGIESVILTGAIPRFSMAKRVYEMFEKMYGISYIISPHPEFATSIGAVLLAGEI